VQSNVHKALGCLGVITDGFDRDIRNGRTDSQALAGSIGPSHAWVHAESFGGEVRVAGMTVRSDDLIHADRHGAIVIPTDIAAKLPDAAELCARRETPILDIARKQRLLAGEAERGIEALGGDSLGALSPRHSGAMRQQSNPESRDSRVRVFDAPRNDRDGAPSLTSSCEKRSDEAIQGVILGPGLLRFARNDGGAGRHSIGNHGLKVVTISAPPH